MPTPSILVSGGGTIADGTRGEITIDGSGIEFEVDRKTKTSLRWAQVWSIDVVDATAAGGQPVSHLVTSTADGEVVFAVPFTVEDATQRLGSNGPSGAKLKDAVEARPDLVRWQYRVVNLGGVMAMTRMQMAFGQLGSAGWELVTIYDKSSNWIAGMEVGFALFKRPVNPGDPEPAAWVYVDR